jgi:hypothetical protein
MTWLLLILMGCVLLYMVNAYRRAIWHMNECRKTVTNAKREFAEFAANICIGTCRNLP